MLRVEKQSFWLSLSWTILNVEIYDLHSGKTRFFFAGSVARCLLTWLFSFLLSHLLGYSHPPLIPSIFDHTSTLVLFPHCILSSPSFPSPVPRVVAVSPQMRLVEDNPSSLSLVEIYKQRCTKKGIEHDNPVSRYYDRLATVQARGTQASHQVGGHMFMPYA